MLEYTDFIAVISGIAFRVLKASLMPPTLITTAVAGYYLISPALLNPHPGSGYKGFFNFEYSGFRVVVT